MDGNDPNAQGQNPADPGNGNVTPADGGQNGGSEGIQSRIDQLTAKYHEAQRLAETREAQLSQMLLAMGELASRQNTGGTPPPTVEIDPEDRNKVEAVVSPTLRRMEQTLRSLEAKLGQFELGQAKSNLPLEVQQRADSLVQGWTEKGLMGKVTTTQDAINIAYGEYARKRDTEAAAKGAKAAFNAGGSVLTSQGAPNPGSGSNAPPPIPPDLNSWPIDAQAEFWEKRLGDKSF